MARRYLLTLILPRADRWLVNGSLRPHRLKIAPLLFMAVFPSIKDLNLTIALGDVAITRKWPGGRCVTGRR